MLGRETHLLHLSAVQQRDRGYSNRCGERSRQDPFSSGGVASSVGSDVKKKGVDDPVGAAKRRVAEYAAKKRRAEEQRKGVRQMAEPGRKPCPSERV